MAQLEGIKFEKAQQNVTNFVSELRSLCGPGNASVARARKLLNHVKFGIPSLDKALKSLRVENKGFLTFNGAPTGALYTMFRGADLTEIMKLSKLKTPIQESEQLMFNKLTAHFPDRMIREMDNKVTAARPKNQGLNLETSALEKIPRESNKIIKRDNAWQGFKKVVGISKIEDKVEARNGCWMFVAHGKGKVSWCKVRTYSCGNREGKHCSGRFPYYNVALTMMSILDLNDEDPRKKTLAYKLRLQVPDLEPYIDDIIHKNYDALYAYFASIKRPPIDVCGIKHDNIESKIIPNCRLCDSAVSPYSTEYISPYQIPINVSFKCVKNSTFWDSVEDFIMAIDRNYIEPFRHALKNPSGWLSGSGESEGSLQRIGVTVAIIVVLVLVIVLITKLVSSSNRSPVYVPPVESQPTESTES